MAGVTYFYRYKRLRMIFQFGVNFINNERIFHRYPFAKKSEAEHFSFVIFGAKFLYKKFACKNVDEIDCRILTLVRHDGVLMSITAAMALEVNAVVEGDIAVGAMHVLEPRCRRTRAART